MTDSSVSLLTFVSDTKAMAASFGLIVSMLVAVVAISKDESNRKRIVLVACACAGFVIGIFAVWLQHQDAKQDEARRVAAEARQVAAEKIAQDIKRAAEAAAINLADLAKLNELSPSTRYHVRLSVDPRSDEPCGVARKIDSLFPGAIQAKGVRVVYRKSFKQQPYLLLFGRDLTLAAAEVYQRLAAAHQLANGLPPIEYEREEQEVDCTSAK